MHIPSELLVERCKVQPHELDPATILTGSRVLVIMRQQKFVENGSGALRVVEHLSTISGLFRAKCGNRYAQDVRLLISELSWLQG